MKSFMINPQVCLSVPVHTDISATTWPMTANFWMRNLLLIWKISTKKVFSTWKASLFPGFESQKQSNVSSKTFESKHAFNKYFHGMASKNLVGVVCAIFCQFLTIRKLQKIGKDVPVIATVRLSCEKNCRPKMNFDFRIYHQKYARGANTDFCM